MGLKSSSVRTIGAAILAVSITLSAAAAQAVPGVAPDRGQASGGTVVTIPEPVGTDFAMFAPGSAHSVALDANGKIYAWGHNAYGQLGDGSTTDRNVPTQVQAPEGVPFKSVGNGTHHSLAVDIDGYAYAWGLNVQGQAGDGSTTNRLSPVKIEALSGIARVTGGAHFSMALDVDGNMHAWGSNSSGQLGTGTTDSSTVPVPTQMPAGVSFESLSSGAFHSVALGSDGEVQAWGASSYGQVGNGSASIEPTPVVVQAPAGVSFVAVAAGMYHSMALGSDGNLYAWGQNDRGQLGDGTVTNRLRPVLVQAPAGVEFASVSLGDGLSTAIDVFGTTYAWGENNVGQLGNGSTDNSLVPVLVHVPTGVSFSAVSAGSFFSLAAGTDGNTYAWGHNVAGQLGDGTTENRLTPVTLDSAVVVFSVSFGNTLGQSLHNNNDGTWSVTSPARPVGVVDVVVHWRLGAVTQTPARYVGGFTYEPDPVAPEVTTPADQAVTVGQSAVFEVTATGVPAPILAWETSRDHGVTWEAASEDTESCVSDDGVALTVPGTADRDGRQYRVVATNSAGVVSSQAAVLSVSEAPAFTAGPEGQVILVGHDAVFTVAATGYPVPAVTWQVSRDLGVTWQASSTDPDASVSVDGLTLAAPGTIERESYQYRAIAGNRAGEVTSTAATLVVSEVPTISHPESQSVTVGQRAAFTVATTGYPQPEITWEMSRANGAIWEAVVSDPDAVVSSDDLVLTIPGTLDRDGYRYRATAENRVSAVASGEASLSVTEPARPDGGNDSKNGGNSELPTTGGDMTLPVLAGALGLLVLGGGACFAGARTRMFLRKA